MANAFHGLSPRPSSLPATRLESAREGFTRKAMLERSGGMTPCLSAGRSGKHPREECKQGPEPAVCQTTDGMLMPRRWEGHHVSMFLGLSQGALGHQAEKLRLSPGARGACPGSGRARREWLLVDFWQHFRR